MRQTLRDYQSAGLAKVIDAYRQGARSVLMVLPTGGGKTTIFSSLMSQVPTALLLVHRRELAMQACNRLREFGVDFGLIMASEPRKPYAKVQVATVQTLARRQTPPAGLVVCDEAHLSTAKTWTDILAAYPRARILGVTATPWRLGGKPLVGAYDACVVVSTPAQLREQGHLCNYVGFSYLAPDLSEVKTTAGEYNEKQSAEAMSGSLIVDNIVEEWGKHARDLSTVVFCVTVAHSLAVTAKFKAAGVAAEHLDGTTPKMQREAILKRVAQGKTMVLCNVGVAVEGLDIPRLKCCVDAAPTKSLAKAMRKWGRVRRPWNGISARIHDHAFNIKLHGLPDSERDYTLNARPAKPPSLSTCEECLALYSGVCCPACAHENTPAPLGERVLSTVADAEQYTFESGKEPTAPSASKPPVTVKWDAIGRKVEGTYLKQWSEKTDYGSQTRYLVKGARRDYVVPGTAMLNSLMAKIQISDLIRITYTGDQALPGGKHRKTFKLEVDDGKPESDRGLLQQPPTFDFQHAAERHDVAQMDSEFQA